MIQNKLKGKRRQGWRRHPVAMGAAVLMLLLFSGTALAAQVISGDPYVLPRGEVVNDDLYVTGGEVTIDGTVEGDLIVAGGFVQINGVVNGDLLAAGGAVVIAGTVQDDVRAAGGGIILSGSVGDDFFAAAGGGWPGAMIPMAGRNVPQGVQIAAGSTIGGDAYLAGGQGQVSGSVGGNLVAAMGNLALSGKVAGNANLDAQTLTVANSAVVQGELRYASGNGTAIPTGVAASVVEEQRTEATPAATTGNVIGSVFGWLLRTVLVVLGYLLVGWLLWTFAPRQIAGPVVAIEHRPAEAGIIGLLAAVAVVPVGAALTFLAVLFWGWFPGGLFMVTFVLGLVALLWLLSPVVSGLWVGHLIGHWFGIGEGELPRLLVGIAALVLVGRVLTLIPCIGDLTFQVLFLVSLMLTVGGWFVARRRPPQEPALLPAPVAPAA